MHRSGRDGGVRTADDRTGPDSRRSERSRGEGLLSNFDATASSPFPRYPPVPPRRPRDATRGCTESQADFSLPLDASSWRDITSRSCSSSDLSRQPRAPRVAVTEIALRPTAFTHAGRPTHTIDMPVSRETPSYPHITGRRHGEA